MSVSRRSFLQLAASAAALGALSGCAAPTNLRGAGGHVVVVGGGFGGATCAKYLRHFDPSIKVTLVDANLSSYYTCPYSNHVIAGDIPLDDIKVSFEPLGKRGITLVEDHVDAINAENRSIKLKSGKTLSYDRLVLSPGIALNYEKVAGYSLAAAEKLPHAWKAGAQTTILRKQIEAMPDGGTFLILSPPNPYRCPPGPYERASLVADYFTRQKPKSKIIILDAKDKFAKQPLFQEAWDKLFPGMISWVSSEKGGLVDSVDVANMSVKTKDGDTVKANVINVIPPQQAGKIITASGLADEKGWAPVNQRSFASSKAKNIYIIGDSCIAGAVPKSGYSANSEGKIAAAAIVSDLNGGSLVVPRLVNTCYSNVSSTDAISVAGVYALDDDNKYVDVKGAGGATPKGGKNWKAEGIYTKGWYEGIRDDTWG